MYVLWVGSQPETDRNFQAGYREGITAGKESALQGGFDEGFALVGAPLGREIGLLRGFASALLAFLTSSSTVADAVERESLTQEARAITTELGNIRLTDVAPPDLEAEQHAREHLEGADADGDGDIVVNEELQEKRELESLEDMMARISAGAIPSTDRRGRPTREDVVQLSSRLKVLASRLQLSVPEG